MLVLGRSPGEAIRIGESISVVVLGVRGNHVRLGVNAPREVRVDREEIAVRRDAGLPPVLHVPRR